jgi:hypothetical protein
MSMITRRTAYRALAAISLCFTACTTVSVAPQSLQAPAQTYRTVIIGKIDTQDPTYAHLAGFFRKGFVQRLGELKGFDSVADASTSSAPPDAILISGTLTEIDKGDAVLRMLVGMGAGREHVTAKVEIQSSEGKSLGHFEARKAYSGGIGIGGAGFLDIEDLTKQVGEQAAQSLVDWSQGRLTAAAD